MLFWRLHGQMDGQMHGWMDGGGGSGTGGGGKGGEEGDRRREHGAKPCNIHKKKSEGGGISGAVIDASNGIFFVSLHC